MNASDSIMHVQYTPSFAITCLLLNKKQTSLNSTSHQCSVSFHSFVSLTIYYSKRPPDSAIGAIVDIRYKVKVAYQREYGQIKRNNQSVTVVVYSDNDYKQTESDKISDEQRLHNKYQTAWLAQFNFYYILVCIDYRRSASCFASFLYSTILPNQSTDPLRARKRLTICDVVIALWNGVDHIIQRLYPKF